MNTKKPKTSYYKRIKLLKFIFGFCFGVLFGCLFSYFFPCVTDFKLGYLLCANIFGLLYFIDQIADYRRITNNGKKNTKEN